MEPIFQQCEYVFNRGTKRGSKCKSKTTNKYCKKHSQTKTVREAIEKEASIEQKPIEDKVETKYA